MIKSMKLELDVKSMDQLDITKDSQWIWALSKYGDWYHIRVWDSGHGIRWSEQSSDIKYDRMGPPEYTHYVVLPRLQIG